MKGNFVNFYYLFGYYLVFKVGVLVKVLVFFILESIKYIKMLKKIFL